MKYTIIFGARCSGICFFFFVVDYIVPIAKIRVEPVYIIFPVMVAERIKPNVVLDIWRIAMKKRELKCNTYKTGYFWCNRARSIIRIRE